MAQSPSSARSRGGRARTGTVLRTKDGRLQAVITLADGTRKRLAPFPKGTSEAYAKEKAAFWSAEALRRDLVAAPKVAGPKAITLAGSDWWSSFLDYRTKLGLTRVTGLYELHIKPALDKHPAEWTVRDCETVRDSLDSRVRAGELSAKTAFNAWAVWTTASKAAAGIWKRDKRKSLKARDGDPCIGVAPPDLEDPKDLQWLYPDEFTRLIGCALVPLEWRRRYALATYLYLRGSELAALSWEDIDLDRGIVKIRHSYDQDRKQLKGTKTGSKGRRSFAIEAALLPMLRAMHQQSGGTGTLVSMPHRKHWAVALRDHLAIAGVKRLELFTTNATSKRVRFHDLRSTGLTWLAIRGDEPLKIQQRAGHTTFAMTEKYVRVAEVVENAIGRADVFPLLPQSIAETITEAQRCDITVEAPGIEPRDALAFAGISRENERGAPRASSPQTAFRGIRGVTLSRRARAPSAPRASMASRTAPWSRRACDPPCSRRP